MGSCRVCLGALAALLLTTSFKGKDYLPTTRLQRTRFTDIKIAEPSDVACDPATGYLYIVSDNGLLYATDPQGTVLQKAAHTGVDFEGVEVAGPWVYVSDESVRKVYRYEKATLRLDHTYQVPYNGARNSGFESIAWNETKGCFVMVSEQNPVTLYELDTAFQIRNEFPIPHVGDVASARWYKGSMYLLSDEDECILQCDPTTYEVRARYDIGVLNPEGLAFDRGGQPVVAADDLQRLYFFNVLPAAR